MTPALSWQACVRRVAQWKEKETLSRLVRVCVGRLKLSFGKLQKGTSQGCQLSLRCLGLQPVLVRVKLDQSSCDKGITLCPGSQYPHLCALSLPPAVTIPCSPH